MEGSGYGVNKVVYGFGVHRILDRSAKPIQRFDAVHGSVSRLDPAMVLLDPIIQILVGAMIYAFVQFSPDPARITIVTIRRDTRRSDAGQGNLPSFAVKGHRFRRD